MPLQNEYINCPLPIHRRTAFGKNGIISLPLNSRGRSHPIPPAEGGMNFFEPRVTREGARACVKIFAALPFKPVTVTAF